MSDLPPGWEWAPLSELGQEVRETVHPESGRPYELWSVPSFASGRPELVDGGQVGSAKLAVQPGDVLICKINPRINRVWQVAFAVGEIDQIASPEWLIFRLFERYREVMAPYLRFYLASPRFREWIESAVSGVTGSHTRAKAKGILNQRIPLPPLSEQRRIVAALESYLAHLGAGVASLQAAERSANRAATSFIEDLVGGLAPLRALGSVLREPLRNGYSGPVSHDGTGTRTITLTAVTKSVFSDETAKLARIVGRNVDDLWLEPGDILVQRGNTPELVGTSALYSGPQQWAIFPDLLIRVRTSDDLLPAFAQLALSSRKIHDRLRSSAKGLAGTMPKIDQNSLLQLKIPVPSLSCQKQVVGRAEEFARSIRRIRQTLTVAQRRSESLRRSLLVDAFAGRLVAQDPVDGPASALLDRIRAEREALPSARRRRQNPDQEMLT